MLDGVVKSIGWVKKFNSQGETIFYGRVHAWCVAKESNKETRHFCCDAIKFYIDLNKILCSNL